MSPNFTKGFQKNYKKRIKNNKTLDKKFHQRITLFVKNPNSPQLKNHKLTGGKKDAYAISITGDVRALYVIRNRKVVFIDIGTHNQVY